MSDNVKSALPTYLVVPAVPDTTVAGEHNLGTVETEVTQAIRRLRRAVITSRLEASMRAGKPVLSTPLSDELDKQVTQLENIQLAYSLKDAEASDGAE